MSLIRQSSRYNGAGGFPFESQKPASNSNHLSVQMSDLMARNIGSLLLARLKSRSVAGGKGVSAALFWVFVVMETIKTYDPVLHSVGLPKAERLNTKRYETIN
ncbi:hypothetical protein Ddc_02653 [Ditylenchus destructor]|nr:hypothetical protein Ddc_02653 [Ditylenchus destructor]